MIRVRCIGHIRTSVGAEEIEIAEPELKASELVERLRAVAGKNGPGFTKYNTIVMVEDGEAFVSAGSERAVRSGERVVLIPFSHGG